MESHLVQTAKIILSPFTFKVYTLATKLNLSIHEASTELEVNQVIYLLERVIYRYNKQ